MKKRAARPFPTGIMADSHGDPESIAAAADFLKKMGCETIFHLGDICDSLCPETAVSCIKIIEANQIQAVKGNNDHVLALNLKSGGNNGSSFETMNYLNALPQNIQFHNAIFTHSLPFEMELGASAMIGKMGVGEATRFFEACPDTLLFRGHSHLPEMMRKKIKDVILTEAISPGQKIEIKDKMSCVVTCGAVTDGVCMVWRPEDKSLFCHGFK